MSEELGSTEQTLVDPTKQMEFTVAPDSLSQAPQEQFTDTDGIKRSLYTFQTQSCHNAKIVFYSPEELPYSEDVIKERTGFIFGDQPRFRTQEEWTSFVSRIQQGSKHPYPLQTTSHFRDAALESNSALFFVESTPLHLLDTALLLGANDPQLNEARKRFKEHRLTQYDWDILDNLAAAKLFDDTGNLKESRDTEGDALFVLSLTGNVEARSRVEKRRKFLDDQKSSFPTDQEQEDSHIKPFELEKLAAVHATRYLPVKTSNGYDLLSSFDGSGWKMPRNTIHFALNHHVSSNTGGSWEGQPYVIIDPLQDLIEQNGKPLSLQSIDTYFEVNPGQPLKLSDKAILIRPGQVSESGDLYKTVGKEVVYKSDILKTPEIDHLLDSLPEEQQFHLVIHVENLLRDATVYGGTSDRDYESSELSEDNHQRILSLDKNIILKNLLRSAQSEPLEIVIDNFFKNDTGISLSKDSQDRLLTGLQELLHQEVKYACVQEQIKNMGFQYKDGGFWSWTDTEAQKGLNALAQNMGINGTPHDGSVSSRVTDLFENDFFTFGLFDQLKDKKMTASDYYAKIRSFLKANLSELSPQSRRMLTAMGTL